MTNPQPWELDDVEAAARGLLGWRLRSDIDGRTVEVALSEVEAYAGETDAASHAFRGVTPRNRAMFGPGGRLYVYRSYGIHWCMNVVVGSEGRARAVLLRGGEILTGEDVAIKRRGRTSNLADGPGKLTQALGVTGGLDGHDLGSPPLLLLEPIRRPGRIVATPRIGISKEVDRPWRFVAVD